MVYLLFTKLFTKYLATLPTFYLFPRDAIYVHTNPATTKFKAKKILRILKVRHKKQTSARLQHPRS